MGDKETKDGLEYRLNGLNELDEFCLKAYKISAIYKEKIKKYHDQNIEKREFTIGDLVVLFNSSLRLFPGKLKSKWTRPFLITKMFPDGAVEFENKEGANFTVNGQRIKIYIGHAESSYEVVEAYNIDEVWIIKGLQSCRDVKSRTSWEAIKGVSSSQQ